MKYSEAVKLATEKDVLFFHIDGGFFLPHRFNPEIKQVEMWCNQKWCMSNHDPKFDCEDWALSTLKRTECEVIDYVD